MRNTRPMGPAPPRDADTHGDVALADELLAVATDVAARAAAVLAAGHGRDTLAVDTKTTGTDMVTEVDRAAEALIADLLRQARPHDAIVGEEGTDTDGTSGVRWVVDPIDGTTNYLYRHPGFSVSVAAEVAGTTTVGVVNVPSLGEVFTAVAGQGAWCNGTPLHCSQQDRMDRALVATGFSYDPERRRLQAEVLVRVLPLVRDIRRMGAASVDLCSVACGRVDAYYERGLQPWDYAAGALVAAEAGAVVSDAAGGPGSPTFVLAANPALHGPLAALLESCGARTA